MNTYTVEFFIKCPSNGTRIKYTLEITTTGAVIMVEDIIAFIDKFTSEYHEDMADKFAARWPGTQQVLKGHHHGVDIQTYREGTS